VTLKPKLVIVSDGLAGIVDAPQVMLPAAESGANDVQLLFPGFDSAFKFSEVDDGSSERVVLAINFRFLVQQLLHLPLYESLFVFELRPCMTQVPPGVVTFLLQNPCVKILEKNTNESNQRSGYAQARRDQLSIFSEKCLKEAPVDRAKEMHA